MNMRPKHSHLLCMLLLCFLLASCGKPAAPIPATEPSSDPMLRVTVPVQTEPSVTEAPAETAHSKFYIPGVCAEDVILYFNEVCLDAEIVNSGDPRVLQKWIEPISYTVYGDPTEEDLTVLTDFARWLNMLEGFPGIAKAEDPGMANLKIHFCSQEDMLLIMGDSFVDMDGAVTFWYTDDEIYDAMICVRTDLDQYLRNSVILEEVYNGLGPIQDSALRPESIIAADFSQSQSLTEMDELILRLLYHPDLQCGMGAENCEAAIRRLYY